MRRGDVVKCLGSLGIVDAIYDCCIGVLVKGENWIVDSSLVKPTGRNAKAYLIMLDRRRFGGRP